MTNQLTITDCDTDEQIVLPSKFGVCGSCAGHGVTDPEAFSNGVPAEFFADDPDFAADYYGGAYDRTCPDCHGNRVVLVADVDRMTDYQKRVYDDHYKHEAELAMESSMRSRGIQF
jgi:cytochrome c5